MKNIVRIMFFLVLIMILTLAMGAAAEAAPVPIPDIDLSIQQSDEPQEVVDSVKLLVLLTLLSLVPAFLIMMTSFTRIVVVLSFLRNAVGAQQTPPNQILIGLALFLTIFIMTPVYNQINKDAIQPYLNNEISQETAQVRAVDPIKEFMFKQTREKDLALFVSASQEARPQNQEEISLSQLIPAFIISELKTAFTMGFVLYVPFLIIDMVVASILMSMGMFMLPPIMISLPFKLLLFVMVDGWYLVVQSLMESF